MQEHAARTPSTARLDRPVRPLDFVPIFIATFLWGWPMIFVKLMQVERVTGLGEDFPRHALNFYRYLAATAVLLALALAARRAEFLEALRRPWRLLGPGALLAAFQAVWVVGVYAVGAAYGALIVRSAVIFSILLAFAFYREERGRIRSPWFLAAVAAGLGAVVGVILTGREGLSARGDALRGTLLLLASSFAWGLYAQVVKRTVRKGRPLVSFTLVCMWATLLLVVPALLEGGLGKVAEANAAGLAVIASSGALCIAATQALYFWSIRRIGIAYTAQVGVAGPVVTVAFSYVIFGEELTLGQLAFGALLIASLYLLVRTVSGVTQPQATPAPADSPAPEADGE